MENTVLTVIFLLLVAAMIGLTLRSPIRELGFASTIIFFVAAVSMRAGILDNDPSPSIQYWLGARMVEWVLVFLLVSGMVISSRKPQGIFLVRND